MSPQPQPISPAVTIAIRVRPLSQKQRKKGAKPAFAVKKQGSSSSKTTVVDDSGNSFEFDHAYAGGVSQDEIYRTAVEPLVAKFNEDLENVTILSYGQTVGSNASSLCNPDDGILSESLIGVFNSSAAEEASYAVSFVEITGTETKDLLGDDEEDEEDVNIMPVETMDECISVLSKAESNPSGTSYYIFTLHNLQSNTTMRFIDLGNSERTKKKSEENTPQYSGLDILEKILKSHVAGEQLDDEPEMTTPLAKSLQDSMSTQTILIAHISSSKNETKDSLHTLQCASRCFELIRGTMRTVSETTLIQDIDEDDLRDVDLNERNMETPPDMEDMDPLVASPGVASGNVFSKLADLLPGDEDEELEPIDVDADVDAEQSRDLDNDAFGLKEEPLHVFDDDNMMKNVVDSIVDDTQTENEIEVEAENERSNDAFKSSDLFAPVEQDALDQFVGSMSMPSTSNVFDSFQAGKDSLMENMNSGFDMPRGLGGITSVFSDNTNTDMTVGQALFEQSSEMTLQASQDALMEKMVSSFDDPVADVNEVTERGFENVTSNFVETTTTMTTTVIEKIESTSASASQDFTLVIANLQQQLASKDAEILSLQQQAVDTQQRSLELPAEPVPIIDTEALDALQSQNSDLIAQLTAIRQDKESLETQLNTSTTEINTLKTQLDEYSNSFKDREELIEKIADLDAEKASLLVELDYIRSETKSRSLDDSTQRNELETKIQELEAVKKSLEQELEDTKLSFEQVLQANDSLNDKIVKLEQTEPVVVDDPKIAELETALKEKDDEINRVLRQSMLDVDAANKAKSKVERALRDMEKKAAQLEQELTEVKSQPEEIERSLANAPPTTSTRSEEDFEQLEKENKALSEQVSEFDLVRKDMSEKMDRLEQTIQAFETLQTEFDAKTTRVTELESECTLLRSQNDQYELVRVDMDGKLQRLETTIKAFEELEEEYNNKCVRILELESECDSLRAQTKSFESARSDMGGKLEEMEETLKALESVRAECDTKTAQVQQLESDIIGLRAHADELELAKGDASGNVERLEQALAALQTDFNTKCARIEELEVECGILRSQVDEFELVKNDMAGKMTRLEETLSAFETLQSDYDTNAARLVELEADIHNQTIRIAELETERDDLRAQAEGFESVRSSMADKVDGFEERVQEIESLQAALDLSSARVKELEAENVELREKSRAVTESLEDEASKNAEELFKSSDMYRDLQTESEKQIVRITELETERDELISKVDQYDLVKRDMSAKMERLELAIGALGELQAEVDAKNERIIALEKQMEETQSHSRELSIQNEDVINEYTQQHESVIQEKETVILDLQNEVEVLRGEISQFRTVKEELEAQFKEHQTQATEMESQLTEKNQLADDLAAQVSALKAELEEQKSAERSTQDTHVGMSDIVTLKTARVTELEAIVEQLRGELKDFEDMKENFEVVFKQCEEYQVKLDASEKRVVELNEKISQLNVDNASHDRSASGSSGQDTERKLTEYLKHIKELRDENDNLEDKVRLLEKEAANHERSLADARQEYVNTRSQYVEEITAQNKVLEEQLTAATVELSSLRSKLEDSSRQIADLQAEAKTALDNSSRSAVTNTDESDVLRYQLENVLAENQKLLVRVAALEDLQPKYDVLQRDFEKLRNENSDLVVLRGQYDGLYKEYDGLRKEADDLRSQVSQFEQHQRSVTTITSMSSTKTRSVSQEITAANNASTNKDEIATMKKQIKSMREAEKQSKEYIKALESHVAELTVYAEQMHQYALLHSSATSGVPVPPRSPTPSPAPRTRSHSSDYMNLMHTSVQTEPIPDRRDSLYADVRSPIPSVRDYKYKMLCLEERISNQLDEIANLEFEIARLRAIVSTDKEKIYKLERRLVSSSKTLPSIPPNGSSTTDRDVFFGGMVTSIPDPSNMGALQTRVVELERENSAQAETLRRLEEYMMSTMPKKKKSFLNLITRS